MDASAEQNPQPETTNPSNEDVVAPDHQSPPASPLANTNGASKTEDKFSVDEVRGVLQLIASTGKFWNDWDELKSMLSFQLKQVLSEYPEAKMDDHLAKSTLGETYQDLVKRLDEALFNFPEGPPFTLQRLCEILLDARDIYLAISKVAVALEKNLLVTTTLSKCMDPHPFSVVEHQADAPKEGEGDTKPHLNAPKEGEGDTKPHLNAVENGMEPSVEDKDEVMTEVEEAEVQDEMTVDTENVGGNVSSSENISQTTHDS